MSGPERDPLPEAPTQAHRFEKARSAQSTALLEDYAELIADLLATDGEARPTDIARRLGVSHATAIKTIGRLKREGLGSSTTCPRRRWRRSGGSCGAKAGGDGCGGRRLASVGCGHERSRQNPGLYVR